MDLYLFIQIVWVEQQHEYTRQKRGSHHQDIVTRGIEPRFADPLWDEQWYLVRLLILLFQLFTHLIDQLINNQSINQSSNHLEGEF